MKINQTIHPKDQMYNGNWERYESVGHDALRKIQSILSISNASPRRILDLACGHGRVARHLRASFPDSVIVGSDLMPHAIEFCANEFGYIAHLSSTDLDSITFDQPFDLIWSGSLMTHLNETSALKMLSLMIRALQPGGYAIWTTHGRYLKSRYNSRKWPYLLSPDQFRGIVELFDEGNYAYVDYDGKRGYGISMTPLPWVMKSISPHLDIRLTAMIERGWDSHQDVIGIIKAPVF